ncbi:protein FAM180B [Onychostruthus taczanowskii]|uniref:protein FAM180B n=1 Tax=Onychostruthus taczanowskii TaxID=356909 RepID=UPI001B804CE8|nr:protein FAM180B [Onychostruthus taczanowskii]
MTENILRGQQVELQALPRAVTRNTERWILSKRGCWDPKQHGKTPQASCCGLGRGAGGSCWGSAAMAQAQLSSWLLLCVFAAFQRLTDEHPHSGTNRARRGPEDAGIMLEMLWGRLDIQANGSIRLRDEELASLRPARRFLQILEEEVPKTPAEIEQHLRYYSLTDTPLPPTEFDRLLFTSVYSAYQVRSTQGLDKTPWIGFFSQLVDEIFRDLCKGLCPANTTLLQASWPWKEKPSHLASLKHFYRSNLARTKRDT